jgi:hypothetical protein
VHYDSWVVAICNGDAGIGLCEPGDVSADQSRHGERVGVSVNMGHGTHAQGTRLPRFTVSDARCS